MKKMQNLCFKICLAWFFLLTLNIHPLLSDDQWPSLDFNDKNKTKVNDALSSCKNVEFERLLNNKKTLLGINEPDKTLNKKNQLDNSLGIEVSRSIETIYTPKQSLENVKKLLSLIKDERLYSAVAYYIIKDFAFYQSGICKSLENHFDTYKIYKDFFLKTKNKQLDPIYENENNLHFFYRNSKNAGKRLLLAIQSKKRLLEKEQFLLDNLQIFKIEYI